MDDAVGAPGAPGAGESWTGAVAARFGAGGGFLAAAGAGDAAAFGAAAAAGRDADVGAPVPAGADRIAGALVGSAVMMLTGGVEAALGNSALVGLPVGIDGGSPATRPGAAAACGGAFHDAA